MNVSTVPVENAFERAWYDTFLNRKNKNQINMYIENISLL